MYSEKREESEIGKYLK